MFLNILLIVAGFYLLIKGSDYLVSGSSAIAQKLGVSALVIGLTVVGFGTSAPEFFVNVVSAMNGSTDIAIGNVLGSNFANILLILGVTALIKPITLRSNTVWKEIPLSLLGIILVLIFGSDILLDGASQNILSRVEGIALLGFFILFLVYTFGIRKDAVLSDEMHAEKMKLSKSILLTVGGLVGLIIGGRFVVDGATSIAQFVGISQNLIALTIVSVGTSLPEFVTSVMAIRKGYDDIAIGNIVGSNIFNIFFVLAFSAVIYPLPFASANIIDTFFVILATLMLFIVLFIGKRHIVERWAGVTFLTTYAGFLVFILIRG